MVRLALVITVLAVGGPPHHAPTPMPGVWVALPHHITRTNAHGRVLLVGVKARRFEVKVVSSLPCTSQEVWVDPLAAIGLRTFPREPARVILRCSIP